MTLILLALSFILGSIPFGFLITYALKGVNIRRVGSGNIGATNVARIVGKPWGIVVFILDFLKGFVPLLLASWLLRDSPPVVFIFIAVLPVIGHMWTPFLRFKGGKGVATSLGAVCGLSVVFSYVLLIALLSFLVWIGIFILFRYVSLASLFAAGAFLIFSFLFPVEKIIRGLALFLFFIIVFRHKKNIANLFARTEHRF